MTGIKDIAKAAGVSPSTVSNVMNGRRNVGEATRQKILELCGEMNYSPNLAGRSLKSGSTRTILFNFSDFDRQFYLEIIHGIHDYACAKDFDLIICTSKSCEKFMNKAFTCGSIIQDIRCSNEMLLRKSAEGYPIVVLDRVLKDSKIKSVIVNNYNAEKELVTGLAEKGYRKFAFLSGPESDDSRERYKAFTDVLNERGIHFSREQYYLGDYREKSGNQAARLIMLAETLPEILICANDNMAIGAIRAFRENGLRVPEDIAVCGFDDTEMARVMDVTTVSIPYYERGYLAAQYLIENVNGSENYEPFMVSAKVKWRSTTQK